jgi:hypothetical protein
MADFEDEHLDVLQNIEFAIINVFRSEETLADYDVDKVLTILISEYQAEYSQRNSTKPDLSPLRERLYRSVKHMCEWRLGREAIGGKGKHLKMKTSESSSVVEMVACLKRVRKSVETWNKRGGQRGYLQYIDQFLR